MNDQTKSLLRTALKIAGGVLVTKGYLSDSGAEQLVEAGIGLAIALYGAWESHKTHAPEPKQDSK